MSTNRVTYCCTNGRRESKRSKEQLWKIDTNFSLTGQKLPPCKAKVVFEKDHLSELWVRKEFHSNHNHDKDQSIIPDQVIYYLDQYLSVNLSKMNNAMEIVQVAQR